MINETAGKNHVYSIYIVLAIITFIAFEPVLHNGFINFDDDIYIYNNPHITSGLSWENIVWAFTDIHAYNYHPITTLSHILDCQIFGVNSGVHHFINLLIHIINVLLLFTVLSRMTKSIWASAFVAALFALHPMHVESVAWASERKDTLSMFFWLLTMLAYTCYVGRKNTGYFLLTLAAFTLGLLAKPMLVTLPFVLLLLDYWPLCRFQKGQFSKLVAEKIPFFAISAILSFVTYTVQLKMELVKTFSNYPLLWRIENAIVSYVIYIAKMFRPVKMAIFYPHPQGGLTLWQIGGSVLILLIVTIIALWQIRKRPYIAVGWLWFLGTLVPVIGIFQVGLQGYADRYTYIPYTGLFIIIVWTCSDILMRLKYRKVIFALSAIIIFSALGAKTFVQAKCWHDNVSLYQHTITVADSYWPHEMLGNAYDSMNNLEGAITEYEKAIQYDPDNIGTKHRLARVYLDSGNIDQSIQLYQKFLPALPEDTNEPNDAVLSQQDSSGANTFGALIGEFYTNANINYAIALSMKGNDDEAIRRYKEALRTSPNSLTAHKKLGDIFFQKGQIDRAVKQYSAVIQLEPNSATKYKDIANSLRDEGKFDDSAKIYQMIIQVNPNDFDAYNSVGIIFAQQGNLNDAVMCFRRAITINPNDPNLSGGYANLGQALNLQGKSDEAIECYKKAIQLDPISPPAHCRLGQILAKKGNIDEAIEQFKQALEVNPNYRDAQNGLDIAIAEKQKLSK